MKSIRTKVLGMNILVIFLVVLLIGSMGVFTANSLLKKQSEIALALMCDSKKEELNSIFRCIEHSVKIMAGQAVEDLQSEDEGGITEEYTKEMLSLFTSIIQDTRGAVAYYLRYNPELQGPKAGFFMSKERGEEQFCEYECTDLAAYEEDDAEHVGWYYIPVHEKTAIWLEPYLNRSVDMFMCSYVTPFYADGQLIGVVGIDIDIVSIMSIINASNVYTSGYGYLINNENRIVIHKDYKAGELRPEKTSDTLEYEVLLNNGLTLVMNVSAGEIYAVRNQLTGHVVACSIVAILVFCMITIWRTNKITRPILALTSAVKELENGVYNVNLEMESDDEIGMLTKSFVNTSKQLKKQSDYINSLAYKDSLTGIKNALAYREAIDLLEVRRQSGYEKFGIVVLDVNGLKVMNDRHGHEAGNDLLINAARLICSIFVHSPVFRIGGDEFSVILEYEDFEKREQLMKQVDERMTYERFESQGVTFDISIAKGMAIYEPGKDKECADIFKRADEAMYANKAEMKERM